MKIILIGPPGAGKGTQAALMSNEYNLPFISTGDMLRKESEKNNEVGIKLREIMNQGDLVPNEMISEILNQRISQDDCSKGFILDGFPRNMEQVEITNKMFDPDIVINFELSHEMVSGRLLERGREDDKEDVIKYRLEVYNKETKPLIDIYTNQGILKNIDGSKNEEEVFDQIKDIIQKF